MELHVLLAQLVGVVGIALLIATFQVNKRATILKVQIVSCLFWALYYVMLGAFTGAGLIFIAAIRSWVFSRYRKHEWLLETFILVYAAAMLITWEGPMSILAFMGITLATFAVWQKTPQAIRYVSLTPILFWLPYNFLSGSYLGMFGDIVTFSSVVIGIIRFDLLPYFGRRKNQGMTEVAEAESVI